MLRTVFADIFLAVAAALVVMSSIGVLLMRNAYRKLHYVTPAALVAPLFVGLAVLMHSGWTINTGMTWLTLLFIVVGAPFLSHATIRAARIREKGDWRIPHDHGKLP